MSDKLLEKMNWRDIEGVIYADVDNPYTILGPKNTKDGRLIQTFEPNANWVVVKMEKSGKSYPMTCVDEAGFYAIVLPKKETGVYKFVVTVEEGDSYERYDSYAFKPTISEKELKKFNAGVNYEVYKMLGSHIMERSGVLGVRFAVWAPEAVRVSVVGDFNFWDGRRHIMERRGDSGVFEIFIPEVLEKAIYKYEIATKGNGNVLKSDPYSFSYELRPNNASIVSNIEGYQWEDDKWIVDRDKKNTKEEPISIYEVHLGSWKRKNIDKIDVLGQKETSESTFYSYIEIAPMLSEYVKNMKYTHIELMPVMEHPFDGSWGYQVTGYYAPTSRYGTAQDFMYFIDYMHKEGIGVILDWVPAHFPKDTFGLARFDGSCLYEHKDPRQGEHPHWGTLIFNYGRPEVSNFLIANALYWSEMYHIDGIRMDAVASMLYLDYGKNDGEWISNIYGGNENLEAIEFFKHLNSIFKKRGNKAMLIAEESTAWPKITAGVDEGGLGFDYKWNMGWMNDLLSYMQTDSYFRKYRYSELTFSMVYAYSENYMLIFSHDEVVHGKASMLNKMSGITEERQYANLRITYAYQMMHPGKKLLFMGQEFAMFNEWWEEREIDWFLLENDKNFKMQQYVKALNELYRSQPALYECDLEPSGFEWINDISSEESIIVFARKGKQASEVLVVVCNFDTVQRENYKIGVPKKGKYKEIFNSDAVKFGGDGFVNPRVKQSKADECDDRPNSIRIKVPALGTAVFKYTPTNTRKPVSNKTAKESIKKIK